MKHIFSFFLSLAAVTLVTAHPQSISFGNGGKTKDDPIPPRRPANTIGERLGLIGDLLDLSLTGETSAALQDVPAGRVPPRSGGDDHAQCCCVPNNQRCEDAFGRENEDLVGQGLIDPRLTNQVLSGDIGNRIANRPGSGPSQPLESCPRGQKVCCFRTDLDLSNNIRSGQCTQPSVPFEHWEQVRCRSENGNSNNRRQCGTRDFRPARGLQHGESSPGEFPFTCILLSGTNDFIGTCALIPSGSHNDNDIGRVKVITAAHKLKDLQEYDELVVRVGEWDASGFNRPETIKHENYTVQRILKHPQMSSKRLSNDLAILYTVNPIRLSSNVNTACLPTCREQFDYTFSNNSGSRCWVAGWGKDEHNGDFQFIQHKVDLPLMDDQTCEPKLQAGLEKQKPGQGRKFSLHRSEICAGGEVGKDACTGDGGSPLVCEAESGRWTVVGLVAWGIGCASDIPGVYVRVAEFQRWIDLN